MQRLQSGPVVPSAHPSTYVSFSKVSSVAPRQSDKYGHLSNVLLCSDHGMRQYPARARISSNVTCPRQTAPSGHGRHFHDIGSIPVLLRYCMPRAQSCGVFHGGKSHDVCLAFGIFPFLHDLHCSFWRSSWYCPIGHATQVRFGTPYLPRSQLEQLAAFILAVSPFPH